MSSFESLKEKYAELWDKAERKCQCEEAKKSYFLALVKLKRARQLEKAFKSHQKKQDRKRRTRALILFSLFVLSRCSDDLVLSLLKSCKNELVAKESKREVNYFNYLLEEYKRIKSLKETPQEQRYAVR